MGLFGWRDGFLGPATDAWLVISPYYLIAFNFRDTKILRFLGGDISRHFINFRDGAIFRKN